MRHLFKNSNKILLFLLLLVSDFVFCQDIHFTQFNYSPLNLNPAQTGMFEGTHRFILNNRTQWRSVTVPYATSSISSDMHLNFLKFKKNVFGLGLTINNDKAGDSEYGTTQVNCSFSVIMPLDKASVHLLSLAVENGVAQTSINYTKLHFDNQWNGLKYDPNLSTGENFTVNNYFYYDLSIGGSWRYTVKKRKIFNSGIALYHLTKPKQSLFHNNDIKLNRRMSVFGNAELECTKEIDVMPSLFFEYQNPYKEFLIGAAGRYIIKEKSNEYTAALAGIYTRVGDAAMLMLGGEYKKWSVTMSYDFNYSRFVPATNIKGGFEIAIIYIINKIKPVRITNTPCPII
ncbi:MAG: PorP/SprF family type IX secretion system membrane protein [Bacteroidales bacterium]|nr:PorP/SprF family type IX secretion system membrane protein [Bacteroidales bacterium]